MTTLSYSKASDAPPALLVNGEPTDPDSDVTMTAEQLAAVMQAYWEAGAAAGSAVALTVIGTAEAKLAAAKANQPPPVVLSIASMPTRVTRHVVKRDEKGRIQEMVDVEEDLQ